MAKKKTSEETQTGTQPASPAAPKRRAPARKKTASAAPPVDVATLAGSEPTATASDRAPSNGGSSSAARQPSQAEIAEAAYFRHLKRGGSSADEFADWIEAERELKDRLR